MNRLISLMLQMTYSKSDQRETHEEDTHRISPVIAP